MISANSPIFPALSINGKQPALGQTVNFVQQ